MTRITIFMGYLNDGLEEIGVLRFNMDILCMDYRLEVLMDSVYGDDLYGPMFIHIKD